MGIVQSLLELLFIPVSLLNGLGVIIAFIWLACLGEWGIIGSGILTIISSSFFLSLLMLPAVGLAVFGVYMMEKNKLLGAFSIFPKIVYTNALITFWCVACFFWVMHSVEQDAFIPGLLWAYGIANAPWCLFASKEPNSAYTRLILLATQVACIVLMVSLLFFRLSFWNALVIVGTVMGAMALLESIYIFTLTVGDERQEFA